MFKLRMRDLALVAVAGGLLAFELVSIGEAVPAVKKALAGHGRSAKSLVASASAAAVPVAAVEAAASPVAEQVSQEVAEAVTGQAHRVAAAATPSQVKQYLVVTRARSTNRSRPRMRLVSLKSCSSCSSSEVAFSVERLREVSKAVDLALKHSAL